ncbi:MAG: FCD domain-containing protein [Henriciella sp.]
MVHTLKPLKRIPVYMKVYQAIESDILSGNLNEGDLLPTEVELCQLFKVTRSSVREGIRLLEQAGFVRRGAAKRLIVSRPKIGELAEATSQGLARGGVTFREVWQALSLMYPSAGALAARHLSQAAVLEVSSHHEALKKAGQGDFDAIVGAAVGFFQAIANGLDNRVLLTMLQSLNMMIEASLRQVIENTPNARNRIFDAQRHILEAIENRDEAEAAEWMSKHIDDLKRGYDVASVDLERTVL